MVKLVKWEFLCTTEGIKKTLWLEEGQSIPSTCPTNTAHTINATTCRIIDVKDDNIMEIKEEITPTGGNFQATTMKIVAAPNTKTSANFIFPTPITALSIEYIAATEHVGDIVDIAVAKDTIIGIILASVSPASAWTSQNYTVGQKVSFTHPLHGSRVYTCILNTVSNENPANKTYWRHGFELLVSPTVITYTMLGYIINLFNGVTTDELGRVVYIDKVNSKIYVEGNITNSYSGMTTYVRQTVYTIKDHEIGGVGVNSIGESKIGGSYVPEDILVTASYTNKSLTDTKTFIARLEYLY